ncbi:cysteine desulfurase family protein [Paenibacillus abyssi]|uniref:cysteine desulfurase n=1 Tax=Paenibacillus abyssi TaxID=1340531 RepID=A0A917G2K8_9BACL|nr:cysteine desulfurase family protein [Paenibacillus abyssi]GGG19870.1 putative cysteine desulfurase IscS 1 [Paenibacillus abyssi]
MQSIYLDHAASTPLHPEVLDTMLEVYRGLVGNPSSIHNNGRHGKRILNQARDRIAAHMGCQPSELVFTSGGTESDNMALIGAAHAMRRRGKTHIITTAIEHHAVLHPAEKLSSEGFDVTWLSPDIHGRISLEELKSSIKENTGLISVMYANNEVGTTQPIEEIGGITREIGAVFHVDAVQALGLLPIHCASLPVDLMSFSAHKINGPQGVGALYIAKGTPVEALLLGGSQERKRRAGTENAAGIAGFGKAVELAVSDREHKWKTMEQLRLHFVGRIAQLLGDSGVVVNGHDVYRVPHIVNLSFPGVDTETMLMNLDIEGIAAASGSACTSGSLERSHVLQAMALPEERLRSAVRFSFGLGNTLEEIEYAAEKIATIATRIRNNA